jgi:ABC-type antimicrobial peptide transport system permease subunit
MFYLHYIFAELRRRKGRTILTSLGLGVGVGLVVAVTALSAGLDSAQSKVLEPLTGVGTDMSVSRPIVVSSGNGNNQDFSAGPGANLSASEQRQLRKENGALSLDFSDFGDPGDKFTTRQFASTDLSFAEKEAAKIASIDGVSEVGKALTLNQITISGTVPKNGQAQPQPGAPVGGAPGGGSNQTGFDQASVTGVDAANPDIAPVTTDQVVDGRYIRRGAQLEAMVSQSYANSNSVKVGDQIRVGTKQFKVVGIAKAPLGGESSDYYVPLSTLQKMSDRDGRINVLQVRADSSDQVETVASDIEGTFKGSDVTTAQDLADRVSGSLVDAKNLSSKLGTALAVVALLAAFGIASLLTLSSVNKRIRELGTLKALGWRQWLVVRQVCGESVATGLLGGLMGAVIGIGGAALIGALGVSLEASVDTASQTAGPFGQGAVQAGTSTVSLDAPVDANALLLAIALAVLGGLIAGAVGGLRAARLRPAEALRSVE